MSCNSAIYTVNNTGTAITVTDPQFVQVPFGSVIRRFGKALSLDGGSIVCCGSGYFDCDVLLNMTPTATGPVTAQLYQDGVAVPGATVTVQGTAAAPMVLPVKALVRNCGCDCNSVLTVRVNASGTINNLSAVVEKL